MTNETKLNNLTNEGMIDLMHHQYTRAKSTHFHINQLAFWKKWIRG
jgi:hypothetical protein